MAEVEQVLRQARTTVLEPEPAAGAGAGSDTLRLFIAEEQQILRRAYQFYFMCRSDVEVVGCSSDTAGDSLARVACDLRPDVMLLGFKGLDEATVEKLEMVRESNPHVAIVLLSAYYDARGMKALREFLEGASIGCAYLLKHTIDTAEQLFQVAHLVDEGRIILDPAVMEGLITATESRSNLLEELTPRELEVLSWMARGYRNHTIARVLCVEPEVVEWRINTIYSKLGCDSEGKHARVQAIMQYLRATGELALEDPAGGW
jgi:DNA-binding NarL/FixJ family response regulator